MNKKLKWGFVSLFIIGLGVGLYFLLKPKGDGPGGGNKDNAQLVVQNMFKSPGCKDYEQASKDYYTQIQKQFDANTVKDIINGRVLTQEVSKKQAAIAADAINKNCSGKVSSDYPFCCKSNQPNSYVSGSCIACNVVNNTLCDSIGKDKCLTAEKDTGIKFCKLDNNQCVYNEDPSYTMSNVGGCTKDSQTCLYKPSEPPSYKWDCLNDPCYIDSINDPYNCDITAKRQSEKCIMVPRGTDNPDHTVTYCATEANALTVASGAINPNCKPYAQ
jgi:hypothetical protein